MTSLQCEGNTVDKGSRCDAHGRVGIRRCTWAVAKWSTTLSKGDCSGSNRSADPVEHARPIDARMT
jgi:hypothetical protein